MCWFTVGGTHIISMITVIQHDSANRNETGIFSIYAKLSLQYSPSSLLDSKFTIQWWFSAIVEVWVCSVPKKSCSPDSLKDKHSLRVCHENNHPVHGCWGHTQPFQQYPWTNLKILNGGKLDWKSTNQQASTSLQISNRTPILQRLQRVYIFRILGNIQWFGWNHRVYLVLLDGQHAQHFHGNHRKMVFQNGSNHGILALSHFLHKLMVISHQEPQGVTKHEVSPTNVRQPWTQIIKNPEKCWFPKLPWLTPSYHPCYFHGCVHDFFPIHNLGSPPSWCWGFGLP